MTTRSSLRFRELPTQSSHLLVVCLTLHYLALCYLQACSLPTLYREILSYYAPQGHETTASSLSWWFYELCRNIDWQQRVREEVRSVRRKVAERGSQEFSISDLESMQVMQATLKEAMRLHPIVWFLNRTAGQDDVIPLSKPITTKSGQQISAIPIRKGQDIDISISSYNRYLHVHSPYILISL